MPMATKTPEPLETIGTFPDLASARVAQAVLEAEGIPSAISDEHLAGLDWRMSGALGGVKLRVAAEHAEAAVALLVEGNEVDAAELDRLAGGDGAITDDDVCSSCGSLSIGPAPLSRTYRAMAMMPLLLFLLWPFFAASRRRLRCSACGHIWRPTT